MPEPNKCPQCGTPLPTGALAGLCPACLLKMGAAEDTVTDAKSPLFNPPPIVELAPLFPQLEILELIGKGGMGAVYKARQKQLDRIVALKILPPGIGHDAAFAERFAREAKALAKLNHPNIVTLYEFGNASGQFYFLMEFVDGVNLRQLLLAGRISAREALAIVPQICDALQFAHDQGIVHRDIKPENILMDRRGRVKVADFGLAKIVAAVCDRREGDEDAMRRSQTAAAENLTDAGKTMGTPNYMSPEQITAPGDVDHRADIYALGVVFYQMLTGELPGKKIAPPSTKVQIDVRLDEIVLRALEKNPALRYQQVSEVKTQIETMATSPGIHADKLPAKTPIVRAFESFYGENFTSSAAIRVGNWAMFGLLGLLGQLSWIAGWQQFRGAYGFFGFFGMLGLAYLIEIYQRRKKPKTTADAQAGTPENFSAKTGLAVAAKSKSRLKKFFRVQLPIALAAAFLVRAFLLQAFVATTDAAAPEIPRGSHFLVWKLTRDFAPGDLIAYRKENAANIGRVAGHAQNGFLLVNRNGETDFAVPPHDILGKVISVYWRANDSENSNPAQKFYIGQTKFPFGDSIEITSVVRTKDRLMAKGHYHLVSADSAKLALYITTKTNILVPTDSRQEMQISKGSGDFELVHTHLVPGLPHVTMYSSDGQGFAGIYFGNKDEADEESKLDLGHYQTPDATETWSPTFAPGEKPDPQKILNEAKDLMDKGDYEAALQRQIWYFNHALEYDQGQTGVRLSFALSQWVELGRRYPKAKQALIEIRDHDTQQLAAGQGYANLFTDVQAINRELQDEDATYALFKTIREKDPQLAGQCYFWVESLLVSKGEYQWCFDHMGDPQSRFDLAQRSFDMERVNQQRMAEIHQRIAQEMAEQNQKRGLTNMPAFSPPDTSAMMKKSAEDRFVGQVRQLIEILVATDHQADAEKIQGEAVAILDDPRLQSAVSDAEIKLGKSKTATPRPLKLQSKDTTTQIILQSLLPISIVSSQMDLDVGTRTLIVGDDFKISNRQTSSVQGSAPINQP